MSASLAPAAVCAVCRAVLDRHGDELVCHRDARHAFPVVNGVPVLINDGNSVFARSDFLAASGTITDGMYGGERDLARHGGLRRAYRRFAQKIMNYQAPTSFLKAEGALARAAAEKAAPRVVVLGAGEKRLSAPGAVVVHTDVALGPGIDYVADAHDIPFPDGSFDLVVAVAVLEHVADPPRVVEEIHRVLVKDGYVYAVTPFMAPVHMGVYDFTRYTWAGYRRLFRKFDGIVFEPALGPGSSLAFALEHFATSLTDRSAVRSAFRLLVRGGTLPLKHLDRFLNRRRAALDFAAGYVFPGRRREAAIPDRQLVEIARRHRYTGITC